MQLILNYQLDYTRMQKRQMTHTAHHPSQESRVDCAGTVYRPPKYKHTYIYTFLFYPNTQNSYLKHLYSYKVVGLYNKLKQQKLYI